MDINLKEIQKIKKFNEFFFSKFLNKIKLVLNLFLKNNKYLFIDTYFGKLFEAKINLLHFQMPYLFKLSNQIINKPKKLIGMTLLLIFLLQVTLKILLKKILVILFLFLC